MITGELKSSIDRIWDAFWSGGIANPLEVMEQITYLLFIRRLDELQTAKENRANRLGVPIEAPVFPVGNDEQGRPYTDLRWSRFKDREPGEMFAMVSERVFPFLRQIGGDESTYSHHMRDARFTIPTPGLLAKVVEMLDGLPMEGRDTKGDLYEYMLSKIASAGQNGQFRTPRHIIALMVAMTAPTPKDEICDPACGTAGFLIAAGDYLRRSSPEVEVDAESRMHFHNSMFHGFDFDSTMLRIGSMNMLLHGVEAPDIRYRDSLSEGAGDEEGLYSLILANPPFAGSLDYESTAQNLLRVVKTKKTELLFLALFLRLLKPGGRAAVIVPDGVLFGSSKAHINLRRLLVEDQKLDAIVKLPSGVFKPYASASTAILVFTKTDSGGTDDVWFYDVAADGWSLDDKRVPLLADAKLGCEPAERLAPEDHQRNNLPDLLTRWAERGGAERGRGRAEQSFCVGMSEIVAAGYDFSPSRYKELVYREAEHRVPLEIVSDLDAMEGEFRAGLIELKETLVRESGANGDRVPTKSLTALCRCVSGATPSKSDPSNWVGEIPWFSAKDLKTPDLVDSQDHVAQAVVDRGKLRLFPAGTVVLVVRGMILRHSVPIGILRVPATINQDLKALVPHEELDADFLAACLRAQTPRILATVSHAAHGTTRLDSTALSAIRIPVVPLPAQRDLAERVTATRRLLAIEAERTRHLEELIGSLQAGVFS